MKQRTHRADPFPYFNPQQTDPVLPRQRSDASSSRAFPRRFFAFQRILPLPALCVVSTSLFVIFLSAFPAIAESDETEELRALVRRLESRVSELENQSQENRAALDDAEARLDAQSRRARALESSVGDDESQSRLGAIVASFDFRGGIAASYNFNTNNPNFDTGFGFPVTTGRRNNGATFPAVQHNTFQLDQLFFSADRVPTTENRAGLELAILYGVTSDPENGTDFPQIQRANASYLAPIGEGVEFRLGRWDSPVGAESIYVGENFNITRGLVWVYQPVRHDGLLISGTLKDGFSWKAGVANNGVAANFDNNNGKSGLFQVGWENEELLIRATYYLEEGPLIGRFANLGSDSENDLSHLIDFYAFWDPSDDLSLWLNFDWAHTEFDGRGDTETLLLAIAGRKQITSKLGVSLRAEGALFLSDGNQIDTEGLAWLTGTLDYSLTENLSLRAELVAQRAFTSTPSDLGFINGAGTAFTKNFQLIAVTQLLYLF